ncbi:hypothetical protein ES705_14591 [subsurface metagenome]
MADVLINILGDASKLKGELDKAGKNVTSFSDKVVKIGKVAAIAGAAVTAAFTAVVLKTASVGDQFDKMSLRTGVAVEDLSALAYAADISGSDIGTLEKGLKALTKVMDDASRGIGEGLDAFNELDIAVVDTEGNLRSTVDVLKEAATKISAIEDPTKQVAYAMDLFGSRAGPQLLPLLKMGEAGIVDLMAKAKELGIVVSTEAATAAAEFTDRLTDLKGSLAGVGRMIGDTLIPIITPLIEKATGIVAKVQEWAEENADMVEGIVKWTAGLGLALAILGPIAVILPSLITGVTLLSHAFLPFTVGAAIVLGIKKLSEYMGDIKIKAFEVSTEFKDWPLDVLNVKISEMEKTLVGLEAELEEIDKPIKILGMEFERQDVNIGRLKQVVKDYKIELGLLKEREAELIYLRETGVELTYEEIKALEETKKLMEELAKETEKVEKEIAKKMKTTELANAQMEIESKMYALTHTAIEVQIKDLYALATKWQDAGIDMDLVAEYVELATEAIYKQNEAIDENIGLIEDIAKVTKDLEDAVFALTAEPYEVVIKGITEKYKDLIEKVKESTWTTEEKKNKIDELNDSMEKEIGLVDKTTEAQKTLVITTKSVTDKILEMTDPLAYNIQQIDELAETWRLAGVDAELIAEAVRLLKEKLEEPPDIDPWVEFFDNLKEKYSDTAGAIQSGILNFVSTAENALGDAFYNILSGAETFGESMRGLFESIVNAVIKELARLAAFYIFKWIFAPAAPIPLPTFGFHNLGGEVKKFQMGGGTDSVLAAVTPGEYIVSKPMTDFIKKFRMFPSNLIEAIAGGFPTSAPAFATGGPVGTPNITTSSFGETKIYIDIHDNRIASDIDVRRLSTSIGDEVLRKINQSRRH